MKTHRITFSHGAQQGHPVALAEGAIVAGDLPAGCVLRAGNNLAALFEVATPYEAPANGFFRVDCIAWSVEVTAVLEISEPAS